MSQVTLPGAITRFGLLQIVIILLVLVTAGVHLDRGITTSSPPQGGFSAGQGGQGGQGGLTGGQGRQGRQGGGRGGQGGFSGPSGIRSFGFSLMRLLPVPLSTLFFLNFIGYILLGAALYLPFLRRYQRTIRWTLIGYIVLTIIAWFLFTGAAPNLLAYIDKPVEVLLIVLLIIEDRQAVHQEAVGMG
ncbi:MAG TPA: hypothetical protein VKR06_10900 [Ktedonosporobacter sp.]|nr:hypothetical protein [Ktedonosporobacter sp.]